MERKTGRAGLSLSQYRYRPELEFVSHKFSHFARPACIGRGQALGMIIRVTELVVKTVTESIRIHSSAGHPAEV
jgi:hypothetical protein